MVIATVVQLSGQLPQLAGNLVPAETQLGSLSVQGGIERSDVEAPDAPVFHCLYDGPS